MVAVRDVASQARLVPLDDLAAERGRVEVEVVLLAGDGNLYKTREETDEEESGESARIHDGTKEGPKRNRRGMIMYKSLRRPLCVSGQYIPQFSHSFTQKYLSFECDI